MDAKDKVADTTNPSARFEQEGRERVDDALHAQTDMTSQKVVKEASRLGGGDTYLVETDLEEADESEGVEYEDGSISALANAGNQER